MLLPTSKAKVGEPPVVFNTTESLKVRVALSVSPALRRRFTAPVEALNATAVAAGARVSMLMSGVSPALPKLPAVSWKLLPATVMLAVPLAKLAVGVKTAVRVRPVPLMAPKLPPETNTSPELPSQAKLLPGSSENVNVMVAVSPIFKFDFEDVTATVGAVVSTK